METRYTRLARMGLILPGLLLIVTTLVFSQAPPPPCVCQGQAFCETAVVNALQGEAAAIKLVSDLPIPTPEPAIFDIASQFVKISRDVTELRSFQQYADLPFPTPMPARDVISRSLGSVADLPVPTPYPIRELVAAAGRTIADLPGPLPFPLKRAIRDSLRLAAATPGMPANAKQILTLDADLVANLPGPLPDPAARQLLSLSQTQLRQNALDRLGIIEQEIAATPEAAPLAPLEAQLSESVRAIPPSPNPCPGDFCN